MLAAFQAVREKVRYRLKAFGKGSLRQSVLILAGSSAVAQALTAAASPVLTRLYSPAEFGELSVYTALLSMIVVVGSLRYQMAIPLPREDREAVAVLEWCLVVLGVACIITAIVAGFWSSIVGKPLASPLLAAHPWLLPMGVLAAGVYQAATYWGIRKEAFAGIASSRVQQSVAQVTAQVGLGFLGVGPIGLVAGYMASQAVGIHNLLSSAWRTKKVSSSAKLHHGLWRVAKRYRRFAVFGVPSALLINGAFALTPVLLVSLYSIETAGLFALTQRIMGLPMRLLGQAIGQTYMGTAAKLLREDPKSVAPLFARSAKRLAEVGVLTLFPAALLAPWAFGLIFGDEWREAGVYVQLLTPMFFAQLIVSPLSQTSLLVERQDLELVGSLLRLLAVVAVFAAAWYAKSSARTTIAAYSIVMAATYGGFFYFYRWLAADINKLIATADGKSAQ